MINCPECNAEISESALKCPSCGFKLNEPKRGIFGKIIKWAFILFNIIMLIWIVGGVGSATEGIEAMDGAEQTGTAIGAGLGAMMLVTLWVVGDIILGIFLFFTRPKS